LDEDGARLGDRTPHPAGGATEPLQEARTARNRLRDENEHLDMAFPRAGRTLQLVGRALTLRCPYCGKGPVLRHWFALRPTCGHCARPFERGEHDYFLGAMLFNLLIAELLFATIFVTALVLRWPDVPWDAIEIGAPLGMAATPFLTYPFSKLLWLAFDLTLRPDVPADRM
jgi:uncharacterized protein (DUF983 family)